MKHYLIDKLHYLRTTGTYTRWEFIKETAKELPLLLFVSIALIVVIIVENIGHTIASIASVLFAVGTSPYARYKVFKENRKSTRSIS